MIRYILILLVGCSLISPLCASSIDLSDSEGLEEGQLRKFLQKYTQDGHLARSYSDAKKKLFTEVFLEKDPSGSTFVKDVYCYGVKSHDRKIDTSGSRTMNVEHSWPQSKFNDKLKSEVQKADMFHLFPTDKKVNNQRANFPFGEVRGSDAGAGSCPSSQIGMINSRDYPVTGTRSFFEPPAEIRGDIARALFYFAIRYDLRIAYIQEFFLKKWNLDDPVTEQERIRALKITKLQGNRNPFIEKPDLIYKISNF